MILRLIRGEYEDLLIMGSQNDVKDIIGNRRASGAIVRIAQ